MEHPKAVGDRSTLAIMLALRELGFAMYVPFGENTRCDLIMDDGVQLSRVQCKTGRLREGAVRFKTCSDYAHHPSPRTVSRDYQGEIDYFAVYCRDTGGVYLVPIEGVPLKRQASLRIDATRNGQKRGIRLADRYAIAHVRLDRIARECLR